MEIRFPIIEEMMAHRGNTVFGAGELACDGFKPTEIPDDVIEARVTATLNGQTTKFVMLVSKKD